jgi:hypothetical protein
MNAEAGVQRLGHHEEREHALRCKMGHAICKYICIIYICDKIELQDRIFLEFLLQCQPAFSLQAIKSDLGTLMI